MPRRPPARASHPGNRDNVHLLQTHASRLTTFTATDLDEGRVSCIGSATCIMHAHNHLHYIWAFINPAKVAGSSVVAAPRAKPAGLPTRPKSAESIR